MTTSRASGAWRSSRGRSVERAGRGSRRPGRARGGGRRDRRRSHRGPAHRDRVRRRRAAHGRPARGARGKQGSRPGKGIAMLVDGLDQLAGVVDVPETATRLAERFWPGALTLVLPVRAGRMLPELLTGGRATLGVRLPDHPVPRALARRLGPLAVSSANRSGRPDARTAAELVEAVGGDVALVLDDGPVRGGRPSSVVAVLGDGSVEVLREGALDRATIRHALG
ncbi:MAG: L-threonylcarbamoyladenylate synthase [Chloroflexota bacterium]